MKISNSWIFNFKLDLVSFLFPFLVASFFIGTQYNSVDNYWWSFMLAKVFIGGGHIFATYLPIAVTDKVRERFNKKLYIVPAIFLSIYVISNFISDIFFMNLLAVTGLMHIYLQHFAWLKMSQSKITEKRKKFERLFLIIVITIPNLLWLFRQLSIPPSYLYAITITQTIPNFNIFTPNMLSAFSIAALLISLGLTFRKEDSKIVIDFGKLLFFASTTVWMCAGLFFIHSKGFFFIYLALSHGASYMAYISQGWPKHLANGVWASNYRFAAVGTVSLICGLIWVYSFHLLRWTPSYLIFLPWTPLLVHYGIDATIWRKTKAVV